MFKKKTNFNVLYSHDIKSTARFFQAIEAEISDLEADKVVVNLGDLELHFVTPQSEPFQEYQFVAQGNFGGGNIFYVEVDNLEKTFNLIHEIGGRIYSQIQKNHWGCKEFLFQDPNGYNFVAYK